MKSIKYISLFALSFFALSCGEKLDDPWSEAKKEDCGLVEMTFSTTIDNEQTRTVLVDDTDIYFQNTDHISIFDGDQNRDFTACIPGGASLASKADFNGVAHEADTYYALYPYTPTATLEGTTIKGVNIPSEQTAVASTFDRAANPSVCVGNRRKLNLKNVGAYLKFTVPSDMTYSKVVVISNDGGAIAGTVNVTVSPTDAPSIDMVNISNRSSKVTLTGTMEAGSTYYVVVLPTALNGGLTMQFYNGRELLGNKSSNNALTVNRAKVKNLGTVNPVQPVEPEVVPGKFTINSAGVTIQFAKGNLQYQASTNTWKFADAQYIALGKGGGNETAADLRASQSDWIDLFGWGCTGIRHEGMTYNSYQPWATSTNSQDYYKQEAQELSVENYTDWGCLFSDENNEWFTLSKDEWEYLNNSRSNSDGTTYTKTGSKRPYYAYIEVNGVPGDLYFADDWNYDKWPSDVTKPTHFNHCGSAGSTTYGSYTVEEFEKIEATGAVFFPITGFRSGVTVGEGLKRPAATGDRVGIYSTRTPKDQTHSAIYVFTSGDGRYSNGNSGQTAIGTNIPRNTENEAHEGYAVRLVRKVKE